jgi:uncharacterized membrane protein SirB2
MKINYKCHVFNLLFVLIYICLNFKKLKYNKTTCEKMKDQTKILYFNILKK